jgi:hypothetical protein
MMANSVLFEPKEDYLGRSCAHKALRWTAANQHSIPTDEVKIWDYSIQSEHWQEMTRKAPAQK